MTIRQTPRSITRRARLGTAIASLALFASFASSALGAAVVTRGDISAFNVGDPGISGRAQMVRTADGKTIVSVHVEGLGANTTYGAHVHAAACAVGLANGHYKYDPAGPAAPPNEIWPGFTTNGAGVGNGDATVDWVAGATAVSVVIHAPGNAKIACADLG